MKVLIGYPATSLARQEKPGSDFNGFLIEIIHNLSLLGVFLQA